MISCVTGSSKPCVYCCSSWMLTTALKREKKYPRSYQNSKERNKEHRRVISANAGSCQHKKKGILNRKMWNWQHRFKRHFRVDENHSGTESASSQHWSSLFAAAPGQAGTLPPPLSSISTCTWLLWDWGGSAMSSFNSSSVSYLWCFQGIPVQTAQAWPHNGASSSAPWKWMDAEMFCCPMQWDEEYHPSFKMSFKVWSKRDSSPGTANHWHYEAFSSTNSKKSVHMSMTTYVSLKFCSTDLLTFTKMRIPESD